ncbi:MAG: FRG domain-containing protein [Gemmatimonadetes bacterium]|nr:FRG domain-containing protein [Gemmatimonadota bacterium]NNM06879.1 FRG domain-containing protein [Gemmatimonadota bacterium]
MSEPVESWRELLDRYEEFKEGWWCFRGDCSNPGALKTSLERAAVDRWGRDWSELPEIEEGLMRRFGREAHLYLPSEPAEGDRIGWLSLMRHHGAPTRLLDWSFSFFVAVHFAVQRADPDAPSSVFAMDLKRVRERVDELEHLRELLRRDPNAKAEDTVEAIIDHSPRVPLIFPLNPWRMNRRLILQQSIFLVPGDITRSFMDNLRAVDDPDNLLVEIPLSNDRRFLEEATRELLSMNMSSATLFPGLDGFAENLTSLIPFPYLRAVDSEVGLE